MVLCYGIKVLQFEILMKRMSSEMQRAKNKIVFHVHNAKLCMKNVDIARQRERQFFLDMFPADVNLENEFMIITAYKIHQTGTLITLGITRENITEYVNIAIAQEGIYTTIPGSFYLRNGAGKFVARLECEIEFMIRPEPLSDYNLRLAIEKDLELPNPFADIDAVSPKPDSAAKKNKKEGKMKKAK